MNIIYLPREKTASKRLNSYNFLFD